MKIRVIEVTSENKGKYSKLSVKYQNDKGVSSGKDVMSFGNTKDTFLVLSQAHPGDEYEVTSTKNEKGYWDWVKAAKVGHSDVTVKALPKADPSRFETPEERAARQTFIIRQSSLSTAVEFLNHVKKSYDIQEILTVANQFENYVFGKAMAPGSTGESNTSIDDGDPDL